MTDELECNSCNSKIPWHDMVFHDEKWTICKSCAMEEGIDNLLQEFEADSK